MASTLLTSTPPIPIYESSPFSNAALVFGLKYHQQKPEAFELL